MRIIFNVDRSLCSEQCSVAYCVIPGYTVHSRTLNGREYSQDLYHAVHSTNIILRMCCFRPKFVAYMSHRAPHSELGHASDLRQQVRVLEQARAVHQGASWQLDDSQPALSC